MASVHLGLRAAADSRVVRGGDGRRPDRRPAPGSLSRTPRRVGVRGAGDAARADGAGRLPRRPARFARGRGRVPGDVPGPDPQGGHDPGARRRRRLAAPRRASGGRAGRARSLAEGAARAPGGRPLRRRSPSEQSSVDDDWRGPLHEELARLPERFRQPVVLCYLEGKTHGQAALELRWSEATLRRRLADARGLLRSRLTRRGVAVSVGALAAAMESPGDGRGPARLGRCPGPRRRRPGRCRHRGLGRRGPTGRQDRPEPARRPGPDRGERRRPCSSRPASSPVTWSRRDRPGPTIPPRSKMPAASLDRRRLPSATPDAKAEAGRSAHGPRARPRPRRQAVRRGQGLRLSARPAGRRGLLRPDPPVPDAISEADGRFQFTIPDPGLQDAPGAGDLEPPDRRGPGPRIRAGLGLVHHGRRSQGTDAQAGQG